MRQEDGDLRLEHRPGLLRPNTTSQKKKVDDVNNGMGAREVKTVCVCVPLFEEANDVTDDLATDTVPVLDIQLDLFKVECENGAGE